jgi:molecular chaperone DnaJ
LPKKFFIPIAELLLQVAGDDGTAQSTIEQELLAKKQHHLWDKYKWVVMLIITATICWLMYRYGK